MRCQYTYNTQKQDVRITAARLVVAVPNIIDPNPEREKRVCARPRRSSRLERRARQELVHLVCHREYRRLVLVLPRASNSISIRQ